MITVRLLLKRTPVHVHLLSMNTELFLILCRIRSLIAYRIFRFGKGPSIDKLMNISSYLHREFFLYWIRSKFYEQIKFFLETSRFIVHNEIVSVIYWRFLQSNNKWIFYKSRVIILKRYWTPMSSNLIWDTWGKKKKVSLLWVPSHSGIKGNKEDNVLATKSAWMPPTSPELFSSIRRNFWRNMKAKAKHFGEITQRLIYPQDQKT